MVCCFEPLGHYFSTLFFSIQNLTTEEFSRIPVLLSVRLFSGPRQISSFRYVPKVLSDDGAVVGAGFNFDEIKTTGPPPDGQDLEGF